MKHIRSYQTQRLFENDSDFELTLPKGHILFHATGEPFDEKNLHPGWYDEVLWTTEESGISQTYIPAAGITVSISPEMIVRPAKDPSTQNLQKILGIEYDYDEVTWQAIVTGKYV